MNPTEIVWQLLIEHGGKIERVDRDGYSGTIIITMGSVTWEAYGVHVKDIAAEYLQYMASRGILAKDNTPTDK